MSAPAEVVVTHSTPPPAIEVLSSSLVAENHAAPPQLFVAPTTALLEVLPSPSVPVAEVAPDQALLVEVFPTSQTLSTQHVEVEVTTAPPQIEVLPAALPPVNIDLCCPVPVTGGGAALGADVVSAFAVGAIEVGDTIPQGSTFPEFVRQLLTSTFYPSFIAPSASLSASLGSQVEAGTIIDLTLSVSLNRGAIRGAMVGSTWNAGATQDYRAGPLLSATIEGVSGTTLTLPGHQLTDGANSFSAEVNHDAGPQPLDSDGEPYGTPLPAGSLTASRTITGRRALFYGCPSAAPGDSAAVRGLSTSSLNPGNGTAFTINIPSGATHVSFAYPAALREVSTVKYVEGLNSEVKDVFSEATVDTAGANGYSPIPYRVYTMIPAEPFSEAATYNVTI